MPLFPEEEINLQPYLQSRASISNKYFAIHNLPPEVDGKRLLSESTTIWIALEQHLALAPPETPIPVLIFSPDDVVGKRYLSRSRSRHRATGFYNHKDRIMLLTGQADNPRFLAILRHESVHAALHENLSPGAKIPFWLDEGMASFFEQETPIHQPPQTNNERLLLIQYLLRTKHSLGFTRLIEKPSQHSRSGEAYARAWALVSCLHHGGYPLEEYFNMIAKADAGQPKELFEKYILPPDESIRHLEETCSAWLSGL